jgi:hypothetical protein
MSLRRAIDAKCKDCIFDPKCGGGTWREQIAQCSSVSCPLWPVRTEPESGPFHNPPRRPEEITREWLKAGVGLAVSALARKTCEKAES